MQDPQSPTSGLYIWRVEDIVGVRKIVCSEVGLIWAHQKIGKSPSVLKDFYQIIVLPIPTFVVGQWSSFLTVMELSLVAMCKDNYTAD